MSYFYLQNAKWIKKNKNKNKTKQNEEQKTKTKTKKQVLFILEKVLFTSKNDTYISKNLTLSLLPNELIHCVELFQVQK